MMLTNWVETFFISRNSLNLFDGEWIYKSLATKFGEKIWVKKRCTVRKHFEIPIYQIYKIFVPNEITIYFLHFELGHPVHIFCILHLLHVSLCIDFVVRGGQKFSLPIKIIE